MSAALAVWVNGICAAQISADALYQVQRFDRKMRLPQAQQAESAPVVRLHQIDLCQVLNLSVEMKYQQAWEFSPEEASYMDLFHAAKSTVEPLRAKMALLRWAVFNYLIGNTDAKIVHPKLRNLVHLFTGVHSKRSATPWVNFQSEPTTNCIK